MLRVVRYWALAGLLVPVIILLITWLQGGVFEWPSLGLVLWPSWYLAAAGDVKPSPDPLIGGLFLLISVALNVVLYSVMGAALWWLVAWLLRRPR